MLDLARVHDPVARARAHADRTPILKMRLWYEANDRHRHAPRLLTPLQTRVRLVLADHTREPHTTSLRDTCHRVNQYRTPKDRGRPTTHGGDPTGTSGSLRTSRDLLRQRAGAHVGVADDARLTPLPRRDDRPVPVRARVLGGRTSDRVVPCQRSRRLADDSRPVLPDEPYGARGRLPGRARSDRNGARLGLFRACAVAGFVGWSAIAFSTQLWMPFVISAIVLAFAGRRHLSALRRHPRRVGSQPDLAQRRRRRPSFEWL